MPSAVRVSGIARTATMAAVLMVSVVAAGCGGTDPLAGVTDTTGSGPTYEIVVSFTATADLTGVDGIADWSARGAEVVRRLEATAQDSQREAAAVVASHGLASTSYWVTNAMVLTGDRVLADALTRLPGVRSVTTEPLHGRDVADAIEPGADPPAGSATWNVGAIGAPSAWSATRTGTGAVVGVIDTGIDASHPALAGTWSRGGRWYDATRTCGAGPCDPVGHGTHVAGLVAGGAPGSSTLPGIGVAPGASLVVAKACGPGGCRESAILDAAQWMLAPGGDAGARPAVVVHAWDFAPGDTTLHRLPDVERAAGLVGVYSVGNGGPGCPGAGSPAGDPSALAVGATDQQRNADPRSSAGPATGESRPKPDVWAPGVGVVSAWPDGRYATGSGSSMAAPHVAGALALRLGADRTTAGLDDAVRATASSMGAVPACGAPGTSGTAVTGSPPGSDPSARGAGFLDAAALVGVR